MNKVYLNKKGQVFINDHLVEDVISVSSKTDFNGTKICVEFNGDYKSEFKEKTHFTLSTKRKN